MNPDAHAEAEQDLALAAELQAALLPRTCPAGCPHQAVAALNRMCGTVGGDFHDFIRLNDEQVAIVVGDVVGHGVRSSLLMAQIMGWLRSEHDRRARPMAVMTELNRMLIGLGERTSLVIPCSMIYMVIDGPTGACFFVNAGHPRPLLCDAAGCGLQMVGARNILLGVEDIEFEEVCHTFEPGQRMILYTDGIIDAANPSDERFGLERLRDVLKGLCPASPQQCAEAVFLAVADFRRDKPQTDDETIVVVDRT